MKRNTDPAAAASSLRERITRAEAARLRTARILRLWHSSPLHRLYTAFLGAVSMTELRAFSLLLLPPGITALFRCLVLPLLTDDFPLLPAEGAAGILLSLLALLFATYRAPMHLALNNDSFLSGLLFDTLALPRPYPTHHRSISGWLLLALGIGLGVLAAFLSPLFIAGGMAVLVFVFLSFTSPEFSLILLGILFPFFSLFENALLMICLLAGLALFSYFLKLPIGRRRFTFAPIDLLVLLLSLLLLGSGIFSYAGTASGTTTALVAVILLGGGYFLAANLLTTRRTVLLFSRGVLFSAALIATGGIFFRILALTGSSFPSPEVVAFFNRHFLAIVETPESLAAYLLLSLPLLLSVMMETRRARWRYLPSLLLILTALALSLLPSAYLVLLLSLLFFVLMLRARRAALPLALLCLLISLLPLFPATVTEGLADALSFLGLKEPLLSLLATQRAALGLIGGRPLGIGLGHPPGVLSILLSGEADAASLYLEIALEAGIPTLVLFLLLIGVAARGASATAAHGRENRFRILSAGVTSGLFALLLFGTGSYLFANTSMLLLFSLMLGLLTALRRIAAEEERMRLESMPPEVGQAATEVRITSRRGRR